MEARDLILSPELPAEQVRTYLVGLGFHDVEEADSRLQQIVSLIGAPERVAALAETLLAQIALSVDPDAALRNFETFLETAPNPSALFAFLADRPDALEVLISLLGASPYLSQVLFRNPEYFYWVIEERRLGQTLGLDYYLAEVSSTGRLFDSPGSALNGLRRLRRREYLRIGTQDLLRWGGVVQTVTQVSDLARALLQGTFEVLAKELLQEDQGFVVLAMGKFGGRELNFSSDVDLIYLFADEARSAEMLRFAREYTRALSQFTAEGNLYRVDLRLRPMGKGGEIAYSEKAYRNYCQTWADTTDRLALIKARPVAGDIELGRRFLESIQDFVFKRYLDAAAVDEIRWVKRRTDEALSRRQETLRNVKLGLGGIREIEFFAQSFQILYGGQQPELRTPNTLEALNALVDAGFVETRDFEILRDAYHFLRDLEHKLQLVHDLQTHSLPEEEKELMRCARRMGYILKPASAESLRDFKADLHRHAAGVHQIFEALFESHQSGGIREIVLNPAPDREESLAKLRDLGYGRPEGIFEGIQLLQQAPAFPHSPSRMRNLLANLVSPLLEVAVFLPDPRSLFSRLDRFCEALGTRAALYTELIENSELRTRLLRVLSCDDLMADRLIRNPELLDSVAYSLPPEAPAVLVQDFLAGELKVGRPAGEALGRFKLLEEMKIAVAELEPPGNPATRALLTELAEVCLRRAWDSALEAEPWVRDEPTALVALGKFGGAELSFRSDLDLVFVFDDSATGHTAHEFERFVKSLREALQQRVEAQLLYKVDFRLRPEGKHATEAVSLTGLKSYFRDRADPWERLAYVKARNVISRGCPLEVHPLVYGARFGPEAIASLLHIRNRKEKEIGRESLTEQYDIKVGPGTLLDIQFLTQMLQVNYQINEPNTLLAIDKLAQSGRLSEADAAVLSEALHFLYRVELINGLRSGASPEKLGKLGSENDHLAWLLGVGSGEDLLEEFLGWRGRVRELFLKYFTPTRR